MIYIAEGKISCIDKSEEIVKCFMLLIEKTIDDLFEKNEIFINSSNTQVWKIKKHKGE